MKTNLFIPKGIVKQYDAVRGHGFSLTKWFRESLKKLNIPFYDECCTDASDISKPVRFNSDSNTLESINNGQWDQLPTSFVTGLDGYTGSINLAEGELVFEDGVLVSFVPTP